MTTAPVLSINDELLAELEAAANDTKGWELAHAYPMAEEGVHPEQWEWAVGAIGEDGDQYPVAVINCDQYDSTDTQKVARYYAAVNRGTILALLAHIAELKQQLVAAGITAENCEMFRRDSQRLNKLDIIGYAYGFQDMHEGNRWMIDGPYCDIRAAIDGIQEAAP